MTFVLLMYNLPINLVDVCPSLAPPVNGMVNTSLSVYGTHVEVTCLQGHRFQNGGGTKVLVECLEYEKWSRNYTDCMRKKNMKITYTKTTTLLVSFRNT